HRLSGGEDVVSSAGRDVGPGEREPVGGDAAARGQPGRRKRLSRVAVPVAVVVGACGAGVIGDASVVVVVGWVGGWGDRQFGAVGDVTRVVDHGDGPPQTR